MQYLTEATHHSYEEEIQSIDARFRHSFIPACRPGPNGNQDLAKKTRSSSDFQGSSASIKGKKVSNDYRQELRVMGVRVLLLFQTNFSLSLIPDQPYGEFTHLSCKIAPCEPGPARHLAYGQRPGLARRMQQALKVVSRA